MFCMTSTCLLPVADDRFLEQECTQRTKTRIFSHFMRKFVLFVIHWFFCIPKGFQQCIFFLQQRQSLCPFKTIMWKIRHKSNRKHVVHIVVDQVALELTTKPWKILIFGKYTYRGRNSRTAVHIIKFTSGYFNFIVLFLVIIDIIWNPWQNAWTHKN